MTIMFLHLMICPFIILLEIYHKPLRILFYILLFSSMGQLTQFYHLLNDVHHKCWDKGGIDQKMYYRGAHAIRVVQIILLILPWIPG